MEYNQGITIDGTFFDVPFVAISRTVNVEEKYNKLTLDGTWRREILGVYYDYEVNFGYISNDDLYLSLFNKLTENAEEHEVIIPGVNGDFVFTAQILSVSDQVQKVSTTGVKMSNLKCNLKAVKPIK